MTRSRIYRAYYRACGRIGCNPAVVGVAALIVVIMMSAVGRGISAHASAIGHGFVVAAACILTGIATGLLVFATSTARAAAAVIPGPVRPLLVPVPVPSSGRPARALLPDPAAAGMRQAADAIASNWVIPAVSPEGDLYETALRDS
jgi:hypothetical protein